MKSSAATAGQDTKFAVVGPQNGHVWGRDLLWVITGRRRMRICRKQISDLRVSEGMSSWWVPQGGEPTGLHTP